MGDADLSGHVKAVVEACSRRPGDGIQQLRQQRIKLAEVGVEGYCADLLRSVRIYFLPDTEPMEVACPKVDAAVATNFDTALIEAAIQQFQAASCTYNEFCAKVMAAGCAGYFVSILDGRTMYFGRAAETLMECLPDEHHYSG